MRYVVDTTFLIDHMRGDQPAMARMRRLWAQADAIMVNEIAVCELMTGLRDADLLEGDALVAPLEFIQPDLRPPETLPCGEPRRVPAAIS